MASCTETLTYLTMGCHKKQVNNLKQYKRKRSNSCGSNKVRSPHRVILEVIPNQILEELERAGI
jgi:hypothetical protein